MCVSPISFSSPITSSSPSSPSPSKQELIRTVLGRIDHSAIARFEKHLAAEFPQQLTIGARSHKMKRGADG